MRINEEIMRRYAELVQDALDTDEVPDCDGISYKHYQNGDVLSLAVTYSFGMGGLMDYSVFHYDVERDKALDQDDLPGLLGVSEETLQNAIVRAAAQKFDEAYHDLEQWEDDPSEFYRYRAGLDGSLTYMGITEQGAVYRYVGSGININGPVWQGAIALYVESDYSGEEPITSLYVTELGGNTLFEGEAGDVTVLLRTFG